MSPTAREQINTNCTTVFCLVLLTIAGLASSGLLDGPVVVTSEYLVRFETEVANWLPLGIR